MQFAETFIISTISELKEFSILFVTTKTPIHFLSLSTIGTDIKEAIFSAYNSPNISLFICFFVFITIS